MICGNRVKRSRRLCRRGQGDHGDHGDHGDAQQGGQWTRIIRWTGRLDSARRRTRRGKSEAGRCTQEMTYTKRTVNNGFHFPPNIAAKLDENCREIASQTLSGCETVTFAATAAVRLDESQRRRRSMQDPKTVVTIRTAYWDMWKMAEPTRPRADKIHTEINIFLDVISDAWYHFERWKSKK